jgi:Mg2+ and Co2+ transporter CorA
MNKGMRLLAIVSCLGLIPAVIGGLLGMNVAGNPWPWTIAQVTFGVSIGMLFCLYLFFLKGWFR